MVGVKQASAASTRNGSQASSARTMGLAGDIVGGVGIATAAVGAVLLIVQATHKRQPAAAFIAPTPRGLAISF
jgi:hypothetical protein